MSQVPDRQSVPRVHAWPSFFLHFPVASQVLVPVQVSGSSALVTATHVPPAPVQAWQAPQDWLQQWLSVQFPVAQSPATKQLPPSFFLHRPVELHVFRPVHVSRSSALVTATQVPPRPVHAWHTPQVWVQQRLSVQAPAVQSLGAVHVSPPFFLQVPLPSQVLVPAQFVPATGQPHLGLDGLSRKHAVLCPYPSDSRSAVGLHHCGQYRLVTR